MKLNLNEDIVLRKMTAEDVEEAMAHFKKGTVWSRIETRDDGFLDLRVIVQKINIWDDEEYMAELLTIWDEFVEGQLQLTYYPHMSFDIKVVPFPSRTNA
jgi:hypothetical protein